MANTKPQRPNRYITFSPYTFELLQETASATGLTVSHIVDQLMRAHLQELAEFVDWLKRNKGDLRDRGVHALEQYGPNDLITELRQLDPTYQPPEARLMAAGKNVIDDLMLNDLRAMLADWKAKQSAQGTEQ